MKGQRWSLRLGPLSVQLMLRVDDALSETLAHRFACVMSSDSDAPALQVELTAESDSLLRPDDKTVVRDDGDEVERHDFRLRRRAGRWRCETLPSSVAAESALRWITGVELLRRGGLLLHASSAVIDGRGLLFLGPSGAGKTTIALECGAERVLSDEVSILAREADQWTVYPSPYWGLERIGEAQSPAPLAAVWLLTGRQSTAIRPVSAADAALGVLNRVVAVDAGEQTNELALGVIERLIDEVPVFGLSWKRGDDVKSVLTSPRRYPDPLANDEIEP